VRARERMNEARPALDATRAERELYDERYQADNEAEREFRGQACRLFSDGAIITRIAALIQRSTPEQFAENAKCSALREALTKCRDKFAEYVELHRAKLKYTISREGDEAVQEKIDRNAEMVALCDAALIQRSTDTGGVE
jgi:hypothetical protein